MSQPSRAGACRVALVGTSTPLGPFMTYGAPADSDSACWAAPVPHAPSSENISLFTVNYTPHLSHVLFIRQRVNDGTSTQNKSFKQSTIN